MIRYIRFSQQFNVPLLQQELAALESALWKEHYNTTNYEGGWSTLQLRSVNGDLANNTAIQPAALTGQLAYKDTVLLQQCPYMKEVIGFFKMEKTAVRLMKLDAGAVIKPHQDHNLNFEQGELRLHIPVSTSRQVKFTLDGELLPMEAGSCWYLNLSLTHSVSNEGNTDRVHLVIDGIVNEWVKTYFGEPQHLSQLMEDTATAAQYTPSDKKNIIAALRQLQTKVADQLADEMEASLQPPGI